jgi:two-component system chemotaxis response regulator CheB
MRVTHGPRENRFRPAVDPLFRTASPAYGRAVIGVVLSGGQDDGALGVGAVQQRGGLAIVQDPGEAVAPSMPMAAIRHITADHVLPVVEMADVIAAAARRLSRQHAAPVTDVPADIAEGGTHAIHHADRLSPASPFTCPDCGGTLWQSQEGEILQFQCQLGHRYTGDGLVGAQSDAIEQALWVGLRSLEESAELRRRMARHAEAHGMTAIASSYERHAYDFEHRAAVIRRVLMPAEAKVGAADSAEPAIRSRERT